MDVSSFIAKRYLFSKKTLSIITVMSLICMLVVALVTMAMIVVLSAFNGIEKLIDSRYEYFDADLTVLPLTDKVILQDSLDCASLENLPGVASCARVIEERVFAEYDKSQRIVILKGVEEDFIARTGLDSMVFAGEAVLEMEGVPTALIGVGVQYDLNLRLFEQLHRPMQVSAVLRGRKLSQNPEAALNKKRLPVSGIFSINIDFDSDYVIAPIDFAADLLQYRDEYSALELRLEPHVDAEKAKKEIQAAVGGDYRVSSRADKNQLIYKTNRTEKWVTFLIMGFILLIATFNIIAALTLLINEKREDIRILIGMGATERTIRRIFFIEGAMINALGAVCGLLLGLLFVYLQQRFGIIRLEGGLVDFYPVEIHGWDVVAIFALVVFSGWISSIAPVRIFTRKYAAWIRKAGAAR